MQVNPVTFVARSEDERGSLLDGLLVGDLLKKAEGTSCGVHKTAIVTRDDCEAIYVVRDERLIRVLDAVIREL